MTFEVKLQVMREKNFMLAFIQNFNKLKIGL